jgi:hypothetical protein
MRMNPFPPYSFVVSKTNNSKKIEYWIYWILNNIKIALGDEGLKTLDKIILFDKKIL